MQGLLLLPCLVPIAVAISLVAVSNAYAAHAAVSWIEKAARCAVQTAVQHHVPHTPSDSSIGMSHHVQSRSTFSQQPFK